MERHRRIVDLNLSKGKVNPVPICLFHILFQSNMATVEWVVL